MSSGKKSGDIVEMVSNSSNSDEQLARSYIRKALVKAFAIEIKVKNESTGTDFETLWREISEDRRDDVQLKQEVLEEYKALPTLLE